MAGGFGHLATRSQDFMSLLGDVTTPLNGDLTTSLSDGIVSLIQERLCLGNLSLPILSAPIPDTRLLTSGKLC